MMPNLPEQFIVNRDLFIARQSGASVVALESAVITHGLPKPENLALAQEMESIVRENGAVPATIALLDGKIRIGLTEDELQRLAGLENSRKISLRDIGIALSGGLSGGTTVAATLFAAEKAGIQVFATGGIGGVHRGSTYDISADLPSIREVKAFGGLCRRQSDSGPARDL
jgi:pseudouridylate synthase